MNTTIFTQPTGVVRFFALLTMVSLLLSAFPASVFLAEAQEATVAGGQEHKITICHFENGHGGEFQLVPANRTADANGHAGMQHQSGKDIIPSFDYPEKGQSPAGTFLGQNLDTMYGDKSGAEWLAEGKCPPTTGSITIMKDAGDDTETEFSFTSELGDFSLKSGEKKKFPNTLPDEYIITESVIDDWELQGIVCNDVVMNASLPSVTIDLEAGDDVTCVFTNEYEQGPVGPAVAITDPLVDGQTLSGTHIFKGEYTDADETMDEMKWAIRDDCDTTDPAKTHAGNVGGFNTPFSWDGEYFWSTIDMSSWSDGEYCLVLNPQESSAPDLRATRTFLLDNEELELPQICSYAGEVISYSNPVYQNDGDPVDANRRLVTAIEAGVAPYVNFFGQEEDDWEVNPFDFFSLGIEGELVYEFTTKVVEDKVGPDIAVWEITGGAAGTQTDEKIEVLVSKDGVTYVSLGAVTGDAVLDIAPADLDYVKFVKLVDDSAGVQGDNGDGYDVDAITIIDDSCADLPPPPKPCTVTIKSDATNAVVEKDGAMAKILTFVHDGWVKNLPVAKWIWGDDGVVNPLVDETQTFVNQFGWGGDIILDATLQIAADNTYSASLNGSSAGENLGEFNYAATVNYDVKSLLQSGNNELKVAVKNIGLPDSTPVDNPAGLYYELVINGEGEDCGVPYVEEVDPVLGCMDEAANNYNPKATEDDSSCTYGFVSQCVSEAPNLLTNGSFEGDVGLADGTWGIFNNPLVSGWTISGSDGLEVWRNMAQNDPSQGEQNAELDGNDATTIMQSVGTVSGATYELSFDFAARSDAAEVENNHIAVAVDGAPILNQNTSSIEWVRYGKTFVADSVTDVSFADVGTPQEVGGTGTLLDNAVLCLVSLPNNEDDSDGDDEEIVARSSSGGGGGATAPVCSALTLEDGMLEWKTRRGRDLTITANGAEIFDTGVESEVDAGSFFVGTGGGVEYELTVNRFNKSDTCTVSSFGMGGAFPQPLVLGEQVSVVPYGGAAAGAGGAAPVVIPQLPILAAMVSREVRPPSLNG